MIPYLEKDKTLIFKVRVVPRASRSEIVGEHDGALRLRIAAPPVDGAANEELVRTLAAAFSVSRDAIEIVAGHTSRLKTVRATGVEPASLKRVITKIQNAPQNATKY
ncbi:MAG: YggU family protein [Pyrinomonadaceae bacterium]|nr:YggU family protein [Pyrinomonadaceae bacterium]